MRRRDLLKAAPAIALVGAVPAAAESLDVRPAGMPFIEAAWTHAGDADLWVVCEPGGKICDGVFMLDTGLLVRVDTAWKRVWNGAEWRDYDLDALTPRIVGRVRNGFERWNGGWLPRTANELI